MSIPGVGKILVEEWRKINAIFLQSQRYDPNFHVRLGKGERNGETKGMFEKSCLAPEGQKNYLRLLINDKMNGSRGSTIWNHLFQMSLIASYNVLSSWATSCVGSVRSCRWSADFPPSPSAIWSDRTRVVWAWFSSARLGFLASPAVVRADVFRGSNWQNRTTSVFLHHHYSIGRTNGTICLSKAYPPHLQLLHNCSLIYVR